MPTRLPHPIEEHFDVKRAYARGQAHDEGQIERQRVWDWEVAKDPAPAEKSAKRTYDTAATALPAQPTGGTAGGRAPDKVYRTRLTRYTEKHPDLTEPEARLRLMGEPGSPKRARRKVACAAAPPAVQPRKSVKRTPVAARPLDVQAAASNREYPSDAPPRLRLGTPRRCRTSERSWEVGRPARSMPSLLI
jgi:hypothetical protein